MDATLDLFPDQFRPRRTFIVANLLLVGILKFGKLI